MIEQFVGQAERDAKAKRMIAAARVLMNDCLDGCFGCPLVALCDALGQELEPKRWGTCVRVLRRS